LREFCCEQNHPRNPLRVGIKLLVLVKEFHQEKKNLGEGISSSGVKILMSIHQVTIILFKFGPVKEYNTQVHFNI